MARASSPPATPASRSWRRWACSALDRSTAGRRRRADPQARRAVTLSTPTPCAGWPRASRPSSSSRTSSPSSRCWCATPSTAPPTSPAWSASATPKAGRSSPSPAPLTADALVEPLRRVLGHRIAAERLAPRRGPRPDAGLPLARRPSAPRSSAPGCPHNTGTQVPDGALVGAGIGCHGMVTLMGADGRGDDHRHHPDGRRGQPVDRHRARSSTTRTSSRTSATAPTSTPASWPSRPPSPPASHHLQAPLQRRRRHDRRPGRHRPAAGARTSRASSLAEGVARSSSRPTTPALPRRRAAQGRVRLAPRPHHRGAGAAADRPGRHRADPRPAVRGREAPRPQAGPAADAGASS